MPTELEKKFVDEVLSTTHELNARVDAADKEQKARNEELTSKVGAMAAEHKAAIDALNSHINRLQTQLEQAQTEARVATQRPPIGERKDNAAHEAFVKVMRAKGNIDVLTMEEKALIVKDFMPAERKALYAADATTGGFFASTDFVSELQAYRLLVSPMRSIARQMTTSGERVQMPALANDASAYWASEQAAFTASTQPTVGMITIPVEEARGLLQVSQQNLEDSSFNLEDLIKKRLGLKFAQLEGTAFVAGTGVGQPRGILSYPIKASSGYAGGSAGKNNVTDSIPYVASGVANNLTADSILNVFMDLKSLYAPNATYIFTRSTLNTIRLFKDAQSRPLWQPFAGNGLSATIYDRPYVEMPDMPEIAANAYPVIVGDFSNFLIVDRITLNIQQLNELYAASGLVGYIARMRVGSDVLLPEAFRVLKAAVS